MSRDEPAPLACCKTPAMTGTGPSVGRRTTRGGIALVLGQAASRLAATVGVLVLAGILTPSDFGIVAIAAFCIAAVNSMFALGVGSAMLVLPQSDDLDRTSLTVATTVGVACCLIVLVAAPGLADLLGDDRATPYLRALAPVLVLTRWTEVRRAMLERQLRFAQVTTIEVGAAVSGVVMAVLSARAGAGAWALIHQELVYQGLMALALTFHRAGSNVLGLSAHEVRRLWGYGRHLLLNSVLLFAYSNLDNAAVARVLGTTRVGLYTFAFSVTNAPVYLLTHAVNRAMLPAYAALRQAGRDWDDAYLRMLRVVCWMTGTVMFGILVHGPRVLNELYGARWASSYGALRVLAVYGLARSVGATTGPVFMASGQPWLISRIAMWQTLAMLLALVPALMTFGIEGGAVAVTVPLVVGTFYALERSGRILGRARGSISMAVGRIWFAGVLVNFVALPVTGAVDGWGGLVAGGLLVAAGSLTYGLVYLRSDVSEVVRHVRRTPPSSPAPQLAAGDHTTAGPA